jgi:hypothetical protein
MELSAVETSLNSLKEDMQVLDCHIRNLDSEYTSNALKVDERLSSLTHVLLATKRKTTKQNGSRSKKK